MAVQTAIPQLICASICALAILAAPSLGQVGETFRIDAGQPLPHCAANDAAPLCQVERSLAFKLPQPKPRAKPLLVRMAEWILGYEEKSDAEEQHPRRYTVVAPVIADYRVEALETLDAADIEALPAGWQESLAPNVLKPGALRIELLVAFEDAYGMRWPAKGWRRHEYLLRKPDESPALYTEEGESSRYMDRSGASSDCVGSIGTPLCTVETFLACLIRGDEALCRNVDDAVGGDARWAASVNYLVSAIDVVEDERLPPGHKYAVTLEEWDRYRHRGSGEEEFVRYLVERSDDGWRVVRRSVIDRESPQDSG